jgi:two-component system, OmpR family, phosphate regulon response regulator PhoB
MNILIVEDDELLASQIIQVFESKIITNRIRIIWSLLEFSRETHLLCSYDIILTDLQLGDDERDLQGYRVIELIRERDMTIPIIVISGRGELDTLRMAFDLWASDYLIKPLRLRELELRVCNWFRQYHFAGMRCQEKNYILWSLRYCPMTNEFYKNDTKIVLTRMNKYIFTLFFTHSEELLHHTLLREKIWWDRSTIVDRNLRVTILRLKKSLSPYGMDQWISNVRGEGYIFESR